MNASNPYRMWLEDHFRRADPWDYGETGGARHQQALELLPAHTGRTLELGCAEGHFTVLLAERAAEVLALELVAEAAQRARVRTAGIPTVSVRQADILQRLPLRQFDTVVCMDLLYYVPVRMQSGVAARIARRVAPGGALLLQHQRDRVVAEW
ncbi:MAG: hypothetical protein QOC95_1494, partial [Thermoleophilaceae bacterium]|nr:hypothetical protein [Thermoleophilaceae bacterium]